MLDISKKENKKFTRFRADDKTKGCCPEEQQSGNGLNFYNTNDSFTEDRSANLNGNTLVISDVGITPDDLQAQSWIGLSMGEAVNFLGSPQEQVGFAKVDTATQQVWFSGISDGAGTPWSMHSTTDFSAGTSNLVGASLQSSFMYASTGDTQDSLTSVVARPDGQLELSSYVDNDVIFDQYGDVGDFNKVLSFYPKNGLGDRQFTNFLIRESFTATPPSITWEVVNDAFTPTVTTTMFINAVSMGADIPEYADHATADGDATLLSTSFYTLPADRTVYRKP